VRPSTWSHPVTWERVNLLGGARQHISILVAIVATLALGLRPRQKLVNVRAKCKSQESHFMLPGV